jgi:hypothetical protein
VITKAKSADSHAKPTMLVMPFPYYTTKSASFPAFSEEKAKKQEKYRRHGFSWKAIDTPKQVW